MADTNPRRTPYMDSKGQRVTGVYTRTTKTGETVFEIGWTEGGKQKWKSVSGGITAAKTARAAELTRVASGDRSQANTRLTFNAAADAWWTAHKPSCRPKTIAGYEGALAHLRPEFGAKRLAKITPDDVARYVRLKEQTLKGWSIMPHLTVMGQIFKYAARRMNYGGQNPVTLLERSERPDLSTAKQQRALSKDELDRLIAAVDDTHRLLFKFAAGTGARISEVLGLTWGNLDLDEGTVTFTHQLGGQGTRVPLKTKRSRREIEMSTPLITELRAAKLAAERTGRHDLVFVTSRGTARKANNVNERALGPAAEAVGLVDVFDSNGTVLEHAPTFHTLRHTHGSHLIADGWDVVSVSARLGHSSVNLTLAIYAHEVESAQRRRQRRESLDRLAPTTAQHTVAKFPATIS